MGGMKNPEFRRGFKANAQSAPHPLRERAALPENQETQHSGSSDGETIRTSKSNDDIEHLCSDAAAMRISRVVHIFLQMWFIFFSRR